MSSTRITLSRASYGTNQCQMSLCKYVASETYSYWTEYLTVTTSVDQLIVGNSNESMIFT